VNLAKARAVLAKRAEKQASAISEFSVWRPTPTRAECDITATTLDINMIKLWDLSPIDQSSFDPFEPPGRPGPAPLPDAPTNITPPEIIALAGHEVGDTLAGVTGTWTGSPAYARQWTADREDVIGETSPGYTLLVDDLGAMIGLRVTATNAGGSNSASAEPVGPILPAARR
jgi:hypothetical protein